MYISFTIFSSFFQYTNFVHIEPELMDDSIHVTKIAQSDDGTPQVFMDIKVRRSINLNQVLISPLCQIMIKIHNVCTQNEMMWVIFSLHSWTWLLEPCPIFIVVTQLKLVSLSRNIVTVKDLSQKLSSEPVWLEIIRGKVRKKVTYNNQYHDSSCHCHRCCQHRYRKQECSGCWYTKKKKKKKSQCHHSIGGVSMYLVQPYWKSSSYTTLKQDLSAMQSLGK